MYLELERCAGYSRCTENWNIALVAADVLRFGTLRWLQRMYWRVEHCAGCSGCYALDAADVRRIGRVEGYDSCQCVELIYCFSAFMHYLLPTSFMHHLLLYSRLALFTA